jgi:NAD(P)H-hydrate repair Nnr-like enzyme with NAD(P)H-hydrate dehydratase domain
VLREAQRVAAASAWWHGMAAERAASAGRVTPLTASALIDAMAAEPLA